MKVRELIEILTVRKETQMVVTVSRKANIMLNDEQILGLYNDVFGLHVDQESMPYLYDLRQELEKIQDYSE